MTLKLLALKLTLMLKLLTLKLATEHHRCRPNRSIRLRHLPSMLRCLSVHRSHDRFPVGWWDRSPPPNRSDASPQRRHHAREGALGSTARA